MQPGTLENVNPLSYLRLHYQARWGSGHICHIPARPTDSISFESEDTCLEDRPVVATGIGRDIEGGSIGAAFNIRGIDSRTINISRVVDETYVNLEGHLDVCCQIPPQLPVKLTLQFEGGSATEAFPTSYCRKQRVLKSRMMSASIPTEDEKIAMAPPTPTAADSVVSFRQRMAELLTNVMFVPSNSCICKRNSLQHTLKYIIAHTRLKSFMFMAPPFSAVFPWNKVWPKAWSWDWRRDTHPPLFSLKTLVPFRETGNRKPMMAPALSKLPLLLRNWLEKKKKEIATSSSASFIFLPVSEICGSTDLIHTSVRDHAHCTSSSWRGIVLKDAVLEHPNIVNWLLKIVSGWDPVVL